MLVALDEGPGPPIKYQYAELGKLYTVVSQLVRCCDVSSRMQSSINGNPPLPNPYGDTNLTAPVMPVQQLVAEILFVRTSYVKKIIEDCSNSEETVKLLRFCCWENPHLHFFVSMVRIHNVLKGIPDDRDGLFDTIQRSKNHYQKRAYQCIKCMVALFSNCSVAYQILQSNETSNGYFLERSHSARMTLAKACELCPEEEPDEQEAPDDQDSSPPEDTSLYPHSPGTTQFQQVLPPPQLQARPRLRHLAPVPLPARAREHKRTGTALRRLPQPQALPQHPPRLRSNLPPPLLLCLEPPSSCSPSSHPSVNRLLVRPLCLSLAGPKAGQSQASYRPLSRPPVSLSEALFPDLELRDRGAAGDYRGEGVDKSSEKRNNN
ncbi:putative ubiquitin carboxyl-terminal hydrolase FAF-X [Goodea atripinnis]|uniref:Ubiquitin carboxyl-terminal hydrolase FAF-X n=1 Tax=Goodea atripinnis TaxID=208336 RepID=A0ABV0P146_9TELE